MKWVTWEKVGVDRMACAWLIARFIDSKAQFAFIPREQTTLPMGAEPFDIPGVRYSHHGGHCSFHAMQAERCADDPILSRIARIVDEADTVQDVAIEPAAQGLDLICRGLRLISESDAAAIQRGMVIYDALYTQLQADEMEGG